MKKFLTVILIVVFSVSVVPMGLLTITASAEERLTESFYTYTVTDGEATIVSVDNSISGDVTVPSTLGGYPVTCIDSFAFFRFKNIASVTIPNGVTSIGMNAFSGCSSLASVTIPNSVTSIGMDAFSSCSSLVSITIPNSVTSIGPLAFRGCDSLKAIVIPNSVISIGSHAFSLCNKLESITVPSSVTSIGVEAFVDTPYYNNLNNWENGVLYINNHLIKAKETISGSYEVKQGTLTIAESAFSDCSSITSITIPNSVGTICERAFYNCAGFKDVYYAGSESDRKAITIYDLNSFLTNATWHYASSSDKDDTSSTSQSFGDTMPNNSNVDQSDIAVSDSGASDNKSDSQNDVIVDNIPNKSKSNIVVFVIIGSALVAVVGVVVFIVIKKKKK